MTRRSETLATMPAHEASALIASRELSPVDLVAAVLERIEWLDDSIHAFTYVDPEAALIEAREAEAEIGSGGRRGPLHGIPVALKDIFDVRRMPTRAGSRVFSAEPRTRDATLVANLRREGAICIGKTAMNEVSCGGLDVFGHPRNPWNLAATPGGSSAGAAAAVAARMVPVAVGGDTGGSVRVPAAFCGIVGLRPTYGRVSRWGGLPLAWSLDQPGPIARSVADAALVLDAISGRDPLDPTTSESPSLNAVSDADALGALRIGVPRAYFQEACSNDSLAAFDLALDALEAAGAVLQEVSLPSAGHGRAAGWIITYVEAFSAHRQLLASHQQELTAEFIRKIGGGACCTPDEYLASQRVRARIRSEFLEALSAVDVIATPAVTHTAPGIGQPYPGDDPGRLARPASLTGLPALSLPCGFSADSLPLGLQLIGRPWGEDVLFRLGASYQHLTDWHKREPPLTQIPSAEPPATPTDRAVTPEMLERVHQMARLNRLEFADAPAMSIAAELETILRELEEGATEHSAAEPLLWRTPPSLLADTPPVS